MPEKDKAGRKRDDFQRLFSNESMEKGVKGLEEMEALLTIIISLSVVGEKG